MTDREVRECPEPGIYHRVPFETYLSWDAISNSSLQPAMRSMAHYRAHPEIDETPQMRLGTLCHAGKFEADTVNARYMFVADDFECKTKDGAVAKNPKATSQYKEWYAKKEEEAKAAGKMIVTEQQLDDMIGVVTAIGKDKLATSYLTGGDYEVCIVAIEPTTGLRCKGRIDHLHLAGRRIADLKTTRDASRFESVIADRSYHRQLAFYADMIEWLGHPPILEHCIVAVEPTAPYGMRSAPLDIEDLQEGRDEYRDLLRRINQSLKSRKWPGYDNPKAWRLPGWRKQTKELALVIGGQSVTV